MIFKLLNLKQLLNRYIVTKQSKLSFPDAKQTDLPGLNNEDTMFYLNTCIHK